MGTSVKLGKGERLRKEQRLGKIRIAVESEKNRKGGNFWKKEWRLGKDQLRLKKGERFGQEGRLGQGEGSGYWEREED